MNVHLEITDSYYPGFQRLKLFSESTLIKTLFIFGVFSLATSVIYFFISGPARDVVDIILFLAFVFPMVWSMTARLPAAAWPLYLGFSVFFLAATAPAILGGHSLFMLFFPVAFFFFYKLHKNAPWILESLGYMGKPSWIKEGAFTAILTSAYILFSYISTLYLPELTPRTPGIGEFLLYTPIYMLIYGVYFGLLYGKLMQRLLDMRFETSVAIIINVFIQLMFLIPAVIGQEQLLMAIIAVATMAIITHFTLGMTYFFCHSTRPLFVGYFAFYIIYKLLLV